MSNAADISTIQIYIDKTLFIRPRRFGKTMNMSMLEAFFSVEYAGRTDLFEGLSMWEEEKYRDLQGAYPVIEEGILAQGIPAERIRKYGFAFEGKRVLIG